MSISINHVTDNITASGGTVNLSNATITGGSVTGITDLAVADGGTGASTAANARINLLPSYTGNAGKVLGVNVGETDVVWLTGGGGGGDVSGPSSSTDNAVVRFDGTTGKLVQNSLGTIDDLGAASFASLTLTTDLAITEGGTGASDAGTARTNLGLAIGTNVQAYDAGLQSIAGLTTSADQMIYTTASDTYATASLTAAGRALLDDVDAAAQRTTLGLAIGTNVQAYDAGLQSISALTTSADQMIYTTGSDTYATTSLTTAGRALLDDADAAAQRTTLGLVIGTNVQAYDAGLQSIAGLTTSADQMIYTTASDTYATASLTAAGRALLDDVNAAAQRTTLGLDTLALQAANNVNITGGSITSITDLAIADGGTGASTAANARTNLGLAIGVDVQAYDAGLQSIAGLTTGADQMIYTTAADIYATSPITPAGRALLDDVDAAAQRVTLLPSYTGNGNKVLALNAGATDVIWTTAGTGTGDVSGPSSSTDNAVVRFDGTTGKLLQNSLATIDDLGAASFASLTLTTDLAIADGGTGASDAGTARTNLGLAIGTNVQAYDAGLQSIAGLTTSADQMIYTTASDTYATTSLTAAGRALLDDADAAAQRTTLGLVIGTNVQAYDAGLQSIAGLTTSADQMIYTTASDTYATTSLTTAGRALLDDVDAAAQRTTLGLGTIATQAANNVSITGGSVTGITDLAVADGGTGASTAANARVNLLPSYTGNGGKVLAVNTGATDVEWVTQTGGGGGATGFEQTFMLMGA